MALAKSQRSLRAWTRQKWRTKSGKPSLKTGERYLPESAFKSLSDEEYRATTRKKRAAMRNPEMSHLVYKKNWSFCFHSKLHKALLFSVILFFIITNSFDDKTGLLETLLTLEATRERKGNQKCLAFFW